MANELLFTVDKKDPVPAEPVRLADIGLKERSDVEEWVIRHPQILGEDVLVVTSEFGDWATKAGDKDRDRLDILGLANDGRLVLAELKRSEAAATIGMQAINYAARAALFTVDKLAVVYQRFLKRRGQDITLDTARGRLLDHAPELSDDTISDPPRIVLMATDFGLDVTTTAVFLTRKLDVDIQLVRMQGYKTASGDLVVTVSRTFPPPDMDELVLFPTAEQEQEKKLEKTREKNTVARLIASQAIEPGTLLHFAPGSEMVSSARKAVMAWVAEDPEVRGRATWQNSPSAPLVWAADGKPYSPTGLVKHIAAQVGLDIPSIAGPRSWQDFNKRSLPEIAAQHAG